MIVVSECPRCGFGTAQVVDPPEERVLEKLREYIAQEQKYVLELRREPLSPFGDAAVQGQKKVLDAVEGILSSVVEG